MNIIPKLRTRFGEGIGVELFINPPELSDNNRTNLGDDATAGVSAFTVDNGLKFAVDQYAVAGMVGAAKTEIVKMHAATTSTATTTTLSAATSFAHNRGEILTFIPYNQIKVERSTDGGSTYAALATIDIRADSTETYYQHAVGASTDYYRVQFYNATSAGVSAYSDGIIGTGFADNSAGQLIREAMAGLGEKFDSVITKEFMYAALNEARDEMDKYPGVEKWSFRTVFDYNAGDVIPGQNSLTLPTNFREPNTYKNLLSVRVGKDNLPLNKVDKVALNRWYEGVRKSTLNGSITTLSTSIVLTDSGDFDASGDVTIAAEAVDGEVDVATYATNTKTTNTLGTAADIDANHSSGVLVWQGASFGYPVEFSVFEGQIVFSQPFGDDYAGENIYLDYYKVLTRINSDADTLDEPYYRIYLPYLRFRIKKRRNKELVADTDDDYKGWNAKASATAQKEFLGQDIRLEIDVP